MDMTKLKSCVDDKRKVDQMMTFVFDSLDNIVGKGEKMLITGITGYPFTCIAR